MADLALLLVGALLVNNFVLAQFLGLCPFMGVTRGSDTAYAMGLATTFVLTTTAAMTWAIFHYVLAPLSLEYLNIIAFIVTIAATVQLTETYLRHARPLMHQALGVYLPLITTNCAVLGVALMATTRSLSLLETLVFAAGAALGFTLVMVLFAALRERLDAAPIPAPFEGVPATLVTAGILSLAFMGFKGLAP